MRAEALSETTKEARRPVGQGRYAMIIMMSIDLNFCVTVS